MHRFVSYIPAIIVALIITIISSLYMDARSEIAILNLMVTKLKAELEIKEQLLINKTDTVKRLQDSPVIIIEKTENRQLTDRNSSDNHSESGHTPSPTLAVPDNRKNSLSVNTKIATISKFVPLTDNQIQRLKSKFTTELDSNHAETESLDQIIGKENADFYREQRKSAFEKVIQESIEKEILFVSRKLLLDPAQEESLRQLYQNVEQQIKIRREESKSEQTGKLTTLEKLVLEEKERNRLLTEGARFILNDTQYQAFIQQQSGNQDMQIWHE